MKQTGLLFKLVPTDYRTGASPIVSAEVNPTGDWRDYLPSQERQYKEFSFDTMSCTAFSALNICETYINFFLQTGKLTDSHKVILQDYIDEQGKVNFSDRFTAIMSGTTKEGNYFQNVWESIRKDGLLPEKDLLFGGTTWDEYHDTTKITEAMKIKAKKILDVFSFLYEWVSFTPNTDFSIPLKHAPLQGAVNNATHAVELPSATYIFDTYPPFLFERLSLVSYSMKGIVTIKNIISIPMYQYFKASEVVGIKEEFVRVLDKARSISGTPYVINSGYRSPEHNISVGGAPNSAHIQGLAVDLACVDNVKRHKILKGLLNCGTPLFIEVAKKHIHVDMYPKYHPMDAVMWALDD